jgi:thiamine biosynthesis lipoprotein
VRFFLPTGLLVAATLLAPAGAGSSPAASGDLVRYESYLEAMGGVYTVVVYGTDRSKLEAAVNAAFEEIARLDQLLSNYKPTSEWSEVNRMASARPVRVPDELYRLLAACQEYSRRSEGAFDITVGPLMKVWGFYRGSGRLPHRAEVRTALASVGWRNVVLNEADKTVRFARSGMELDPGGIGKGYAVDRVAGVLRESGIRSGFISAATSTVFGIGAPPSDARGWEVRIVHPRNRQQTVERVYLKDESLSTSGNYEKFFTAGNRMYSHIMDPRTGFPAQGMLQVSVVAPKAIDSEAWTKPVYINGVAWFQHARQRDRELHKLRAHACPALGRGRAGEGWDTKCAWLQ